MAEFQSELDLHQLLVPTPTREFTLHRDSASASSGPSSDAGSFVIPEALSRSNSVYSFSRASFSTQIASLASMNLPSAETLGASIKSLPSSRKAVKTLNGAADQIQLWTKKALKVLEALDADEDVEWAAAAGRDGLDDVEKTINKFENLVNVYVVSIEELQTRQDIADVKPEDLQSVVEQMEIVLDGWDRVRKHVKKVKKQVELAMEWEELWSTILAEVGAEMDALSQLVFDMEEKRHTAHMSESQPEPQLQNVDLNELENLVDEPKANKAPSSAGFGIVPALEGSPLGSPIIENAQDDSMLLALFARMQPLRASLDFLPMRLSSFQTRAEKVFPSACSELDEKKDRLERNWGELSKEADTLRRELSEDRWVIVFRNAARQAQKMCESVERSVLKVQEAINEGYQRSNPATLAKRVESFEAKKMHYGPAILRVLGIIQKGLKDRLTVNGEILRLHKDLSSRMRELTDTMEELENFLEPVTSRQNSRLRESISSIVSADRSLSSATMAGTPGSSPASSIDFSNHTSGKQTPKYGLNGYSKPRASSSSRPPPLASANRRSSLLPHHRRPTTPSSTQSVSQLPRRGASPAPGPPSVYRQGLYIPPKNEVKRPSPSPLVNKPRWSSTVKTADSTLAPTYRNTTSPTPYRKAYTPRSISSTTALPLRSPLGRESSSSPAPVTAHRENQYKSFAERVASPVGGNRAGGILDPPPYHRNRNVSAPHPGTIRSPSSLAMHSSQKSSISAIPTPRPPSALNRSRGQSIASRMSSINARLDSRGSMDEPVLPDLELDQENRSEVLDEELDQVISEPSSSPLSRKTVTRPGSVMGSGRGKRVSMLPLPVGGRNSSLGFRAT
ncbi:uncharacterized protein HMPREF1541_05694 [Cyphellophora europaea CBS 101466]|uniref:Karyogamy protein n=1 Tax=Cyphellophora europaea (strain CBS 101466) TaxID=1220924 RepID=W2RT30_CYPE1|nr:uncharacterized protein HMPREF1541_05694 [Cyphellophora europaea CBS 101466]ETN39470.1 hypothetical protein HMPREF1541_05694 [Cyphellophora europaea CBS 101466]